MRIAMKLPTRFVDATVDEDIETLEAAARVLEGWEYKPTAHHMRQIIEGIKRRTGRTEDNG